MDFTNIDLLKYIPTNLVIVVITTYIMGIFLKKSSLKDKYITISLMIFAIVFSILITAINSEYNTILQIVVNGILYGIICWGISVGLNQLKVQSNKIE